MFMSPDITSRVRCGNCSRTCTGETLCKSVFTNGSRNEAFVALTPNYPSKIVPVNLPSVGGRIVVKSGSYMSSIGDVAVKADCDCCSCAACCGGLGFIRQSISGNGTVFLTAGGTVLTRKLDPNETLVVDTDSVVGFQDSVKFGVRTAGGCCSMCFGGEGMFNSTMTGPGLVIVQSMSFEKYKRAVAPPAGHATPGEGGAPTGA